MAIKRIPATAINAGELYQDGDLVTGQMVNEVVKVLKDGVNYNKFFIDAMFSGTTEEAIVIGVAALSGHQEANDASQLGDYIVSAGITETEGLKAFIFRCTYGNLDDPTEITGVTALNYYKYMYDSGDGWVHQYAVSMDTFIQGVSSDFTDYPNIVEPSLGSIVVVQDATVLHSVSLQNIKNVLGVSELINVTVPAIEQGISEILDGTQTVKKSEQDASGNVITTTYETKAAATSKKAEIDELDGKVETNAANILLKVNQTEFDAVVIEGDSSVEAAQARVASDGITTYTTLKERLDAEYNNNKNNPKFNSTLETEAGTLGEELLDNTGWTSTGWTGDFDNGFIHTVGQTSPLQRTITLTGTKLYLIQFTLISTVVASQPGFFTISIGNSVTFETYKGGTTEVIYSFGIKSVSDGDLVITPISALNGTITNLSCKEILLPSDAFLDITDSSDDVIFEMRNTDNSLSNLFLGYHAGQYTVFGDRNVGIGKETLAENTTGFWNTGIGFNSLKTNKTGSRNVGVGFNSLLDNISGHRNIALGSFAQRRTTHGANNIAIGADSLWYNTVGNDNVSIGSSSLGNTVVGEGNIAIGTSALYAFEFVNTIGTIGIGYQAGYGNKDNYNIFIGNKAGRLFRTGTNNIFIGSNIDSPAADISNYINIGNAIFAKTNSYIYSINETYNDWSGNKDLRFQLVSSSKGCWYEVLRNTNTNAAQLGGMYFINPENSDAGASTRKFVARILSELVTADSNADDDSGANLKFSTKEDGGNFGTRLYITDKGNIRIGGDTKPTAKLHIEGGSTSAGTAPIKLTGSSLNTTPEAGAIEFDGTNLYFTDSTNTRHTLAVVA